MTRRLPSPDFDPRIADWLESGPDDAPDLVLETILAAFPSIPQRRAMRAPWRSFTMNRLALIGATAVIAIAVIGGLALLSKPQANVGTSSPPPDASLAVPSARANTTANASAIRLDKTFISPRYGYSIDYPGAWAVTPAVRDWAKGKRTLWGDPALDTLAGTDARFVAASQPLADGKSADDWYTDYCVINGGSSLDCGSASSRWQPIEIGGVTGYLDSDGEHSPPNGIAADGIVFDAAVVSGGRGYEFTLDGRVDRATFDAMVASVKFANVPALDASFTSARHGLSVRYPQRWTASPATKPWTVGSAAPEPPNPSLDVLGDPADPSRTFVLVSQPLAKGIDPATWLAAYERSAPQMPAACWPAPAQMEQTTVDGQTAWIHGGVTGCGFVEAIVFRGRRVYELTGYGPTNAVPYSRPLFDALLAGAKLDPASANDRP
jgi:hypothetical protein